MDRKNGELKCQFLLSGSYDALPRSCIKLRSYLNIHASNLASQYCLKLPKSLSNKTVSCPYCYFPWNENKTFLKLIPSSQRDLKLFRKSLKNVQGNDENLENEPNTLRNKLVLKCNVCTKKTAFSLVKNNITMKKVEHLPAKMVKKKKKKKKKDLLCGLNLVYIKKKPDTSSKKVKKRKKISGISSQSRPERNNFIQELESRVSKQGNKEKKQRNQNIVINPFAAQPQNKRPMNINRNIAILKKSLKEEQNRTKKSLEDFLTLI